MSKANKCNGVTNNCTKNGQLSCEIIVLDLSLKLQFYCMYFAITGGKVNADATVSRSLIKKRPKDFAGNCLEAEAPKCWAQALSLAIPQVVLAMNVRIRFWMLRGKKGMIVSVSVRLLVVQVTVYTKNIHLNLQELKKVRGVVNSFLNPFVTPSQTVALPLANSMTERSRIALVGDTQKAATDPASISFKCLYFTYVAMLYVKFMIFIIRKKITFGFFNQSA